MTETLTNRKQTVDEISGSLTETEAPQSLASDPSPISNGVIFGQGTRYFVYQYNRV